MKLGRGEAEQQCTRWLGFPKSRHHGVQVQRIRPCSSPRKDYSHAPNNPFFFFCPLIALQFLVYFNLPETTPPYLSNWGQNISSSGKEKC